MKTFLLIAMIVLSFSAVAEEENRSCSAMIEELKISPEPSADGELRRIRFEGTTDKEGGPCVVEFLPDFCTFQIGSPLKTPDMYYLMSTDDSSIKIKFMRGENFYINTVTKITDVMKIYKKTFNIRKAGKGYNIEFRLMEGRFFRNEQTRFSCNIKRV